MAKKPKTLKEIAIELLEKYEASETCCIWEYSGNIRQSEKLLKKEINKYRKMIEAAGRKDEPQFDKDINVRSKDEPQTEVNCDRCKHKGVYSYCHYCDGSGESFEPQTEREGE